MPSHCSSASRLAAPFGSEAPASESCAQLMRAVGAFTVTRAPYAVSQTRADRSSLGASGRVRWRVEVNPGPLAAGDRPGLELTAGRVHDLDVATRVDGHLLGPGEPQEPTTVRVRPRGFHRVEVRGGRRRLWSQLGHLARVIQLATCRRTRPIGQRVLSAPPPLARRCNSWKTCPFRSESGCNARRLRLGHHGRPISDARQEALKWRLATCLAVIGAVGAIATVSGHLRSTYFWSLVLYVLVSAVVVLGLWGWRKAAIASLAGAAVALGGWITVCSIGPPRGIDPDCRNPNAGIGIYQDSDRNKTNVPDGTRLEGRITISCGSDDNEVVRAP